MGAQETSRDRFRQTKRVEDFLTRTRPETSHDTNKGVKRSLGRLFWDQTEGSKVSQGKFD